MRICSHCNAQFSDEHSSCVHCHRKLDHLHQVPEEDPPDLTKLHHLTDEDPAKVSLLLDRLQDAGVSFTLVTDDGARIEDWGSIISGWKAKASVYVELSDRELAERLHREFLKQVSPHLAEMDPRGAAPTDCCPACHQPLAQGASSCLVCGLVFPEA